MLLWSRAQTRSGKIMGHRAKSQLLGKMLGRFTGMTFQPAKTEFEISWQNLEKVAETSFKIFVSMS